MYLKFYLTTMFIIGTDIVTFYLFSTILQHLRFCSIHVTQQHSKERNLNIINSYLILYFNIRYCLLVPLKCILKSVAAVISLFPTPIFFVSD